MKKDFNFVFFACVAAVILSLILLYREFIPQKVLFAEDNPLNESEVMSDELE